jgi:hypothetical protein
MLPGLGVQLKVSQQGVNQFLFISTGWRYCGHFSGSGAVAFYLGEGTGFGEKKPAGQFQAVVPVLVRVEKQLIIRERIHIPNIGAVISPFLSGNVGKPVFIGFGQLQLLNKTCLGSLFRAVNYFLKPFLINVF